MTDDRMLNVGTAQLAMVFGGNNQSRPTGVASIAVDGVAGRRTYLCDPVNHVVDVLDEFGLPLFSFGGHGEGPGQMDTPMDVAILSLDGSDIESASDAILAVAERGNNRVQLFQLDGAWLGIIEDTFRLGLSQPSRLDCDKRHLRVTSAAGDVARVDVAAALLPQIGWYIGGSEAAA